ncbi:hypothetical protein [Thermomonospora umbrina]|uniref:FXSXX-COOH protein n=1 Tax=Thermomonospora umbrina TaxID=111806 RepID=A0A3D9SM47_9ACTN|nr:hypothetical protein [Thermomonospora umbrina]REE95480.1 hypothetical protein DFJ69_0870 [Thermomonospora umbrina]
MQRQTTVSDEAIVDVSGLTLAELDELPALHPLWETLREALSAPVDAAAGFDSNLTPPFVG